MKSRLVSASHLYRVARAVDLGPALVLSKGEDRSGGREKQTLLADGLEAVIAALYVDGGLEAARAFVETFVVADVEKLATAESRLDPKGVLQELAQSRKLPLPRYQVLSETGPDHQKQFTVEVRVGKDVTATGEGSSKKTASQRAAERALSRMAAETPDESGTSA